METGREVEAQNGLALNPDAAVENPEGHLSY